MSRSGYYAWRERPPSAREPALSYAEVMADQQLLEQIKAVHKQSQGRYGSPRIYEALLQLEIRCSRKRVARLMRQHGIWSKRPRRRRRTTDSAHSLPVAPNRLQQDFSATAPDQKWCANITCIATGESWLYLAIIIDLYSRLIVGWAIGDDLSRQLALAAFRMATRRRRSGPGLIHHSDRGSQYASGDYQQMLASWKMLPSMSGVGNCYDNAPAESWFATLKVECVDVVYEKKEHARTELFEYMEVFYNRQRLHSKLNYLSPVAFEQQHHQLLNEAQSLVH